MRRGVPQFIEGYGTEESMDRRAAPLITAWIVLWSVLFWSSRSEAAFPWWVAAVGGSLAFVVVGDLVIDTLRGRRPWRLPPRFDLVDIATFGILPVVPTALVQPDPAGLLFSGLNVLLGIGAIYVVIGFGLLDLARWAAGRLREQLVHIATLVSRTLPLLLILVIFLMFSAELWEAAHALHGGELAAVLALLVGLASVLIATTFRPQVGRLEARLDWEAVRREAATTPASSIQAPGAASEATVPRLTWLERRNVDAVILISQLLQSTFVSLIVFAFLVVFGLIVVPASVQSGWIGAPVTPILSVELLGETRVLSTELAGVSALLGGIVGLYFTGLALTDPTYRAEHFASVVEELEMLLSARALYRLALEPGSPEQAAASVSAPSRPES